MSLEEVFLFVEAKSQGKDQLGVSYRPTGLKLPAASTAKNSTRN